MLPGTIETHEKEFIHLFTVPVYEAVQTMKQDVIKEVEQEQVHGRENPPTINVTNKSSRTV